MDFTDQLGRVVTLPGLPKRIVSLVPSQTELLYHLGLANEVVGITKFCVHPAAWHQSKTRVGGTKTVNLKKIKSLKPDLIIANKEENEQEQIENLAHDFPVWVSNIHSADEAFEMIESIGGLIGKQAAATSLRKQLEANFSALEQRATKRPRTAYLVWKDPYMAAGGDTFISDMLSRAGLENVFQNKERYPAVILNDLMVADCSLLLLSSEPYPFRQTHMDDLQKQLPDIKIVLVDGEVFSWYGSRLLLAPSYFTFLHRQIASIV